MDKLRWLVNEMDKSTKRALINIQHNSIPIRYELIEEVNVDQIKGYKGKLYVFNSDKTILRNDSFNEAINSTIDMTDESIKKLLVFDEYGNFIDWSKVNIFIDERVCYIYPIDDIILKTCYILQDKISYREEVSEDIYDIYFHNGKFVTEYTQGSTGISFENLTVEYGKTTDGFIVSDITNKHNVFSDNIILFHTGQLKLDENILEGIGNVFRTTDTETVYEYLIIYSEERESIDNIAKYTKHISIVKDILNNVNLPEYIDLIQNDFDFRYDPELSQEENQQIAIDEILSYSNTGMDKLFDLDNKYICREYDHNLLRKIVNNGYLYIPRTKVHGNIDTRVIVFYNGELFNAYGNIKYIANNIVIPLQKDSIKDGDIMEIMFFTDVRNTEFNITLQRGEEFNYSHLASKASDILFYSFLTDGCHLYDIEEHPDRNYIIPFRYKDTESGSNIVFDNTYYHNRQVKAVSKRQFRHQKYSVARQYKFNYKLDVYDIEDYITNNEAPTTIEDFSNIFVDRLPTSINTINDVTKISFGEIYDEAYQSLPHSSIVHEKPSGIHVHGYLYVPEAGLYDLNLMSIGPCKINIDDISYCAKLETMTFGKLQDSTNIESVQLEKGYHKFDIYSISGYNSIAHGISLSWKLNTEHSYHFVEGKCIYSEQPELTVFQLTNTMFRYCTNKNNYIVFVNNRMIDSSEAIFRFCGLDQIYESNYILFNRVLEEDDIIDIIYTPEPIIEVLTESEIENRNGFIDIERYEIGHTLSKRYCSVFLNGKKIPTSKITDISSTKLRIDYDTKTIHNLCVTKHNIYQNLFSDLFNAAHDAWTDATNMMTNEELETMLGSSNYITDVEADYTNLIYEEDVILWTIITNFWIKKFSHIDAEVLFHYNDDEKFLVREYVDNVKTQDSSVYCTDNISKDIYIDEQTGHEISEFEVIDFGNGNINYSEFTLTPGTKYSISVCVWHLFEHNSKIQDRFKLRLYNTKTGKYLDYRLSYLDIKGPILEDIPRTHWINLYFDDIIFNKDYNVVRLVFITSSIGEKIRLSNAILEESPYHTERIEIIPIDAELITGCELPYNEI